MLQRVGSLRGVGPFRWLASSVAPRLRPSVAAGLVASEVALRSVFRLARWTVSDEAVSASWALVVGGLVGPDDAPALLLAVLYGYLIYVFTPTVFPEQVASVTTRRGFRLLTAANAVQFPVVLLGSYPFAVRALSLGGFASLAVYVVAVQRRSILERDGYPVGFADAFTPTVDVRSDYDADPDGDRLTAFWVPFGLLAFLAFAYTCFVVIVLGLLLVVLYLMYPVPELAVLGWVGYRYLPAERLPAIPGFREDRPLDVEASVVESAGVATQGLKGLLTVVLAVFGFSIPLVFLFVSVAIVVQSASIVTQLSSGTPSQWVAAFVGYTTALVLGCYGTWYWFRQFVRLPWFLDAWRERLPVEVAVEYPDPERPLRARPPGLLLPMVLLVVVMVDAQRYGSWPEAPVVPPTHLAAWTALLGVVLWTAYRGQVGRAQEPSTDALALPAAFLVQMLGAFLWMDLGGEALTVRTVTGRVPPERLLAALLEPMTFGGLVFVVLLPYVFFLPDAMHRFDESIAGGTKFALFLSPLAAVVATAAVRGSVVARYFGMGVVLVVLLVAGGLLVSRFRSAAE